MIIWDFARFGVHAQLMCLSCEGTHAILVTAVRSQTMPSWKHFVFACAAHKVKRLTSKLKPLKPPSQPLATRKPQPPFPHGTCLEHPQTTEVLKVFVTFFSLKWAQRKSSNVNKAKKFCTAKLLTFRHK